jgi:hypothetical protein
METHHVQIAVVISYIIGILPSAAMAADLSNQTISCFRTRALFR